MAALLHTSHAPLSHVLWSTGAQTHSLLRGVVLVILGSMMLTLSAKVSIPFYPVPMTMQTFVVLVLGMAYGWRLGVASVLLYLAEGAMGLPVFAGTPEKGIGLAYMLGTTGGYLAGFVFAVALCGWLAERGWDRSIVRSAGAMVLGNMVIYTFGLAWLGNLVGWDKPILEWGVIPFLPADGLKIILAAVLMPTAWAIVKRIRPSK